MSKKITLCALLTLVMVSAENLKAETEIVFKVYTVKQGDTFFKISQKFYNDGEKWREIKEYNGFIKNSHWIFPGDEIIIPIEQEKKEIVEEQAEDALEEKLPEINHEVFIAPYDPDSVVPLDFKYAGTVASFTEEVALHAQRSKVILDIGSSDGVKMNDKFDIYRSDRKIYHPETKTIMGILIRRVGKLTITDDISESSCIATINSSKGSIKIGDFVRAKPE